MTWLIIPEYCNHALQSERHYQTYLQAPEMPNSAPDIIIS